MDQRLEEAVAAAAAATPQPPEDGAPRNKRNATSSSSSSGPAPSTLAPAPQTRVPGAQASGATGEGQLQEQQGSASSSKRARQQSAAGSYHAELEADVHSGVVEAASAVGCAKRPEFDDVGSCRPTSDGDGLHGVAAEAAAEGPAAAREARSKKPRQGSCKRAGVEAEHASIRGATPQAPGMRGAEPARGRPLVQGGGEVRGLAAAVAVAAQRDLPEADEHGHLLAQAGPITFCVACGSYAMHVAQGLKGACQGRPTSKSNTDVLRRKKRPGCLLENTQSLRRS